ncbi:MAG: tetratricopeptide repeat protein [Desulfobacteraceae bacterium]
MRPLRLVMTAILAIACAACASNSSPPPERRAADLRLSIRHLNKGTMFYNKGCFVKAVRHFQEAHERFAAQDNIQGTAESLNSLANAYYRLNDMDSAVLLYDEALELYRLQQDIAGQIRALANKSTALASSGRFKEAGTALDQADALAASKTILTGLRLKARAILKIKAGDTTEAKRLLLKSMRAISKKEAGQYASAQYTMGYLLLSTQQPQEAIPYLEKALDADRSAHANFGIGQDLEALGDCHMQLRQYRQALTCYKRSLKIFVLLNNANQIQRTRTKLELSAAKADADIQATRHWVDQWLAGEREANVCR